MAILKVAARAPTATILPAILIASFINCISSNETVEIQYDNRTALSGDSIAINLIQDEESRSLHGDEAISALQSLHDLSKLSHSTVSHNNMPWYQ